MDNPNEDTTVKLDTNSLNSRAACPERYEIRKLIGHGGMGMVFHAFDTNLNRDVAIKVLFFEGAREPVAQERFLREAKTLAILQHPNIVHMYSSGLNAHGNPYHVMEFLDGQPLSKELTEGSLSASRFYVIFSQIIAGLMHAHEQKIVHRDLKPSNIMYCGDVDEKPLYKIIDFGIARIEMSEERAAKTITRTDAVLGSPLYISPEQCRGQHGDSLSDIYSLGCLMYECISGSPPLEGETAFETMYKQMSEVPERLDLKTKSPRSTQLAKLVSRCLEKKPEDRPQTVSEIADELKQIFSTEIGKIDLFSNRTKPVKRKKQSSLATASLVITIIAGGAAAGFLFHQAPAPVKIKTANDKTLQAIEKASNRLSRWKDPLQTTKTRSSQISYLDDLFSVGHELLNSKKETDIASAMEKYNEAIQYCERIGPALDSQKAAAIGMRAKAEDMLGKNSDSEVDFAQALEMAKKLKVDYDLQIDVLLERVVLRIKERKFPEALRDFKEGYDFYESSKLKGDPLDAGAAFNRVLQKMDKKGDDRSKMATNAAVLLESMKPNSSDEAVQMMELSNQMGETMTHCFLHKHSEIKNALKYSESLLPFIKGHDELKKLTMALQVTYKDYMQ